MTDPALRKQVHESLQNAIDNGYAVDSWAADQIVDDLRTYDAELENVPAAALMPIVEAWLTDQAERRTS